VFSTPNQSYCCTAVYRVCSPLVPPTANVKGTASPAAASGTTTLNWYNPTIQELIRRS